MFHKFENYLLAVKQYLIQEIQLNDEIYLKTCTLKTLNIKRKCFQLAIKINVL